MSNIQDTIQKQATVDTSWTEVLKIEKPESGVDFATSILEHVGNSDNVDFRIRYVWRQNNETKPATMKKVTGMSSSDDALPTTGRTYGAFRIVIEAKAQNNTVDVQATLILGNDGDD